MGYSVDHTTMPLCSNEEWRARIGSSWCALGRPFKRNSSVAHQGIVLGYLQLRVSAGAILRYGLLMMVMAIIAGCGILVSWSLRCGRAIKGMLWSVIYLKGDYFLQRESGEMCI